MGYPPKIGRGIGHDADVREELAQPDPEPKVLGSIDPLTLTEDEMPPPWEVDPRWAKRDNTDARLFVDVPDEWELRWLNPRMIDQFGFRWWKTIDPGHPRVRLKVPAMKSVDNLVRRGGSTGDILCYMPKSWVESKERMRRERVDKKSNSSITKQQRITEEINRGTYGRYVSADAVSHPTHTMGEGSSMKD